MSVTNGSESWYDAELGEAVVINETTIPTDDVMAAFSLQAPEVAALVRWSNNLRPAQRQGSIFERDRYVTPGNIYEQMRVAYDAVESDDVISGVLDSTEALAFSKVSFETEDEDEEDVWNQWAGIIDLDARLREMWRELFTVSQFYAVTWWGTEDFKVRGKSKDGVKRKKSFTGVKVPKAMGLLDPLKVTPVGRTILNRDQLAYVAEPLESDRILQVLNGQADDPYIRQVMLQPYVPELDERAELAEQDVNPDHLFLLNPNTVWRHTATKSQYQKFAPIKLKACFELLDMKHQLRQMDRAHLIGGTNFIVLITKGSDQHPAHPEEVAALATSAKIAARTPVLVGDHRLKVEIITPKLDNTLKPERYNIVDGRITARLYGMFVLGNYAAGASGDDSLKLARVVAKGMESRRHMLMRSLEKNIFTPMLKRNDVFTDRAKLKFHPKRISLDFDASVAQFMQDLRDRGDLSRDSMLAELDFDQADEAMKRTREKARYDKIFETIVPFNGAAPGGQANPQANQDAVRKAGGRNGGGNRNGGGAAPGSGQGQAPRNPTKKAE